MDDSWNKFQGLPKDEGGEELQDEGCEELHNGCCDTIILAIVF